jgi:DNA-binding response OmpR family regulator
MNLETPMDLLLANEPLEIVTPRILICDDNEMGRALLRRVLSRRGYLIDEAIDGCSALEAVERGMPDMVLLDLRLPDLDGAEVLRQLRCDHDSTQLPVIMVSAEHDGEVVAGCLSLGASDYITKPVPAATLCARVAAHLDAHFAGQPPHKPRQNLQLVH